MSSQTEFDKLDLLGVEIDAVTIADAITFITDRAQPGQPAGYVIKPYVEFLDCAYRDLELQDLLNHAELAIPDGIALVWAAAWLYAGPRTLARFWLTLFQIVLAPNELRWPLPDRAAGINFTWPLLQAAANQHLRVYLIGNPQASTIEHTARTLQQTFPQLNIVGAHTGRDQSCPPGHVSSTWLAELETTIRAAAPDLVLVGAGFPLQDRINAHLASHLNHGIFIGEGGTFDYEAFGGRRPKAPATLQHLGLEWLWRLIQEPRRFRRQLAIPRFIWRIWRSR